MLTSITKSFLLDALYGNARGHVLGHYVRLSPCVLQYFQVWFHCMYPLPSQPTLRHKVETFVQPLSTL